ncbi:NADPH-dependent oxidoreductase [Novosphingobium flavum]|uniref:NADPH-dependent oxidoreductase n=1 Tax=Novosphingobium flavum TaxID=1778672 RepID=A0A7X1FR01_9SPHN|nr:NADPH-dependent oxidoreductase [Novosphingobium flavum]MBC2665365.1 NADPH-dependent oxidoreductase [Novosphingobium flavum]
MSDFSPHTSPLHKRYRQDRAMPEIWNETLDIILSHRSVRGYLPDALDPDVLPALIAAASSAPTSSNLQAWSMIAIEDHDRKVRLSKIAHNQKHVIDCPLFLVWLVDLNRSQKIAELHGEPSEGLSYFETFLVGAVDTALAAQNAMIAAQSMGLGSIFIGGMRNDPLAVSAELGLPSNVFALFGQCIGKQNPERPSDVKPRLPPEAVVFSEQYGFDQAALDAVQDYDARAREFQREQGMKEQDWTKQISKRVNSEESLDGRHTMREVLMQLGFGLK